MIETETVTFLSCSSSYLVSRNFCEQSGIGAV